MSSPQAPIDRSAEDDSSARASEWQTPGAPRTAQQHSPRSHLLRRAVLSVLAVAGTLGVLHAVGVLHPPDRHAIGGIVLVVAALVFLIGPWFVRLARSLSAERAARIREQERAELAAHLHDSVLQTLALIQRRAGDAREVAALARRQERELRRWLFERPGTGTQNSVKMALQQAAAEVEERHGVPVEAIVVGDAPLDARIDALVLAAREAMTNAAKFAGSERVDLYAEVEPGRVQAYVRDRGVGFDPQVIPPDRRGVRESMVARMTPHGGRAQIRSSRGHGTEVELSLDRTRGERAPVAMSPVGSR
jgi:signal transduction histidine kinase